MFSDFRNIYLSACKLVFLKFENFLQTKFSFGEILILLKVTLIRY